MSEMNSLSDVPSAPSPPLPLPVVRQTTEPEPDNANDKKKPNPEKQGEKAITPAINRASKVANGTSVAEAVKSEEGQVKSGAISQITGEKTTSQTEATRQPEQDAILSVSGSTPSAVESTPSAAGPPVPVVPPPKPLKNPISLNFDDADVYQVLQTVFGEVLKVNYVVDARVKGRVTFRSVAPIAREHILPIMEVILRLNGIGVVEDSGLYRIVPISDVSREPSPIGIGRDPENVELTGKSLVQLIPILYLQSTEIARLITPFLSTNAVVVDIAKSNQIIVVDTDASVKRILHLVNALDSEQQRRKQAQVFVYHVQNGKAKNVGNLLQQIFLGTRTAEGTARPTGTPAPPVSASSPVTPVQPPQTGSKASVGAEAFVSDGTKIFVDETINAIVVLATPEDYSLIKETILKIDVVPRQVVIEGVIAQVALTDNLSLGLSGAVKTSFQFHGGSAVSGTAALTPGALNPEKLPTGGFTFVGKVGDDVRAVISALATRSKAKLLAAPHIIVADNREARIQVGQQVPIVTSETFGSTTIAPQRTIQYKDIGIILKVTPQVNDGGLVSLALSQEVSTYSTIELFTNEKNIILNKTEASTNVVVQDGETIIIGGLIREDISKSRSGIPVFSRIPLLGFLFGNTSNEDSRTEIIILLTPHVARSQRDAKELTEGYISKFTATGRNGLGRGELMDRATLQKKARDENRPTAGKNGTQTEGTGDP